MNAASVAAIVKVAYSITLFQNSFCLLVISYASIAIFFFLLFLLSSIYCIVLLEGCRLHCSTMQLVLVLSSLIFRRVERLRATGAR